MREAFSSHSARHMKRATEEEHSYSSYRRTDGTLASLPFTTTRTPTTTTTTGKPPPPSSFGSSSSSSNNNKTEEEDTHDSTLTTQRTSSGGGGASSLKPFAALLGKERTKTKLWKLVLLALLLVGFSRASSKTSKPKRARIVVTSSSSSSSSSRLIGGSFASRKESLERHHRRRNSNPAFNGGGLGEEGPRHGVDWKATASALGRDFREKRRQKDAANAWNGKPQKYGILAWRGERHKSRPPLLDDDDTPVE